ncbi:MAG: hypothetical protein HPY44_03635 [Armatimonadetes bacterium]|nr:hypothetical protein [Armatimonadota bacterium]
MSKYNVDYKALAAFDRAPLREFDEQVSRNIQREIEAKRLEEEEARRKKAKKKKRKRK